MQNADQCGHLHVNGGERVMTNECWAWLVACHKSVSSVCSNMKNSIWSWDGRLKSKLPPPHHNIKRVEKVWSAAPRFRSVCFLLLYLVPVVPVGETWKKKKKVGKYPPPTSLLASPIIIERARRPFRTGHWTTSLSLSLMNVNMAIEGAKTEELLRGLHSVNMLGVELHEGKEGHNLDC